MGVNKERRKIKDGKGEGRKEEEERGERPGQWLL